MLICVYGDPSHSFNTTIWQEFQQIISDEGSICIIGDFNAIADEQEKVGDNPQLNSNNRGFQRFLFDFGLVDLGFKGPAFTWTNRPHASNAIFERLDRVVATSQWIQMFPQAYVNHLPRVHSDHAPVLLRTHEKPSKLRKFCMENWWLGTEGFQNV